jgi:hypothetical protein
MASYFNPLNKLLTPFAKSFALPNTPVPIDIVKLTALDTI